MNHAVVVPALTQVEILSSLARFTDAQLDRVTRGASVMLGRHWFRLLDSLDLGPLVGETVRLQYAVATQNGDPIALCPFFVAAHPTVRFVNSFEKAFFTGMKEELLRAAHASPQLVRWLPPLLDVYRRLLRLLRVRTDGWLLAISPLTYRGGIPTAAMDTAQRHQVRAAIIERLKTLAAAENLPFCLMCVPEEEEALRATARACGLDELFLSYDMYIPLPGSRVEDYVASLPSNAQRRTKIRREMKLQQRTGVALRPVEDWGAVAPELTRMYEATYSKYGDHFAHPPSFWPALSSHLGPKAEAFIARHGDEPLGFTTLCHGDNGDMVSLRSGRFYVDKADGVYFALVFYEPIRRAYELGCRRLWLGPGGFETKRYRGAIAHPLYGYVWLPTRRARLLLLPYLKQLTRYVGKQLQYANQPHGEASARATAEDDRA